MFSLAKVNLIETDQVCAHVTIKNVESMYHLAVQKQKTNFKFWWGKGGAPPAKFTLESCIVLPRVRLLQFIVQTYILYVYIL